MKRNNLFWGVFFIIAAVSIIARQLGHFTGVNVYSFVITVLLIPVIIQSLFHLNFSGVLFPIAILGIIYAEPLGIQELVPWPILLTALLGSIGLSIIFGPSRYIKNWNKGFKHHENFQNIVNSEDDDIVDFGVSFGASIKYVNSKSLKKANLGCSFGALKVYLDNAILDKDGAEIHLEISFAGVELFIPKEWRVVNDVNLSLGGIEEKNNSKGEGPIVRLTGNIKFSGVQIFYV